MKRLEETLKKVSKIREEEAAGDVQYLNADQFNTIADKVKAIDFKEYACISDNGCMVTSGEKLKKAVITDNGISFKRGVDVSGVSVYFDAVKRISWYEKGSILIFELKNACSIKMKA